MRTAPTTTATRRPPHRWLVPVLLTLVALLLAGFAAVPAQAKTDPSEWPQVSAGTGLHVPVLMYRYRHSVWHAPGQKPDVTFARNVAAFNFTYNGVEMVIVIASVGGTLPNKPQTTPIDLYRQDPATGEWSLVGLDGKPLTVDGRAVDWKNESTPTFSWTPKDDPLVQADPDLMKRLKAGLHTEPGAAYFLELHLNGANATTTKGLSELKCFDNPDTTQLIATVKLDDCDTPHNAQAIGAFTEPSGSFPGREGYLNDAETQCQDISTKNVDTSKVGTDDKMGYLAPDSNSWNAGYHTVICTVSTTSTWSSTVLTPDADLSIPTK